jgi:5-methylcytosine-specific restriction endonuclease McrA
MLTPRDRLSHKLRDGAYRARQMGNSVTVVSIKEVEWWLEDLRCYYCRIRLLGIYALEHKHPLAKGGAHELANIAPACMTCNEAKHILTEAEFKEWLDATTQ